MAIYKDVSSLEVVAYTVPKDGTFADGVDYILEKLDAIPEADVEPVRHGHWIKERNKLQRCSVCHNIRPYTISKDNHDKIIYWEAEYCRCCSAKMDEEEKEQ